MSMRARKAGDSALLERKVEKKYDEEEAAGTPQRVMEWINETLKGLHDPCPNSTFRELHSYLRDGVALCKLINKLLEHDGKPIVSFKKKATSRFVASANAEQFNQAAHYYGVPETSLFQTADLWEGQKGPFLNVVNCLSTLGFTANRKEFFPQYETIVPLLPEGGHTHKDDEVHFRKAKAGDSAAVFRKLEKRYDEEEKNGTPGRITTWLNTVLQGDHPPCDNSSFEALYRYLRSGVVLCKLMNKLLQAAGNPAGVMYKNAPSRFVATSNMEKFNEAAHFYGVPDTALFQTADLWEGNKGPFLNVVNCLNTLGFVANNKGFNPRYEYIVPTMEL